MSGQWLFIEPIDVWFFRDNKPFIAAQNFVARSMFPPTPQTVLGALRTAYLEQEQVDWAAFGRGEKDTEVGTPNTLNGFRVQAPFVARYRNGAVERFFPAPLDLVYNKDAKDGEQWRLLKPVESFDWHTNRPFEAWRPLQGGGDGFKEAEGWLSEAQFERYLKGERALGEPYDAENIFVREERVGLALDYTRRANRKGHFYHAEFIRMREGFGLLAHVNKALFPESGALSIGGEARSGRYYSLAQPPRELSRHTNGRVRIVLLTPAYFSGGWQPASGDWSPWVGGGKLVSLAIGKPLPLSGWDIVRNQPRPLRNYVPAGSVFFFEDAALTGVPFTETPNGALDHGAMGFGMYATGIW